MKTDWITIALENGGVMTTSKGPNGFRATLHWKGKGSVEGKPAASLAEAITSLNQTLQDDAGSEMEF